jgi:hypothetical protein
MAHGLVPVLPREANIDLLDFGLPLDTHDSGAVKQAMDAAALLPPAECCRRAMRAIEEARAHYSEEAFERRLREAVLEITNLRTPVAQRV